MLHCVRALRYWKSGEDAAGCADAFAAAADDGLFALADGVSRAPYAEIWARALVDQFVAAPLISSDRWEVRWWLEQVQQRWKHLLAAAGIDDALVRRLPRPAAATLITARVTAADAATVTVQLFAVGDACALWMPADAAAVSAFPLTESQAFDADPAVVPSDEAGQRSVNRLLRCFTLRLPRDATLVLASDALAAFLLQPTLQHAAAFAALRHCDSLPRWAAQVQHWRGADPALADDDTTALVLQPGAAQADVRRLQDLPAWHDRVTALRAAVAAGHWRRVALLYGDGTVAAAAGCPLSAPDLAHAHAVADAFDRVRAAFNAVLAADAAAMPTVRRTLADHLSHDAALLAGDPSAQILLQTIAARGLMPAAPATRPLALGETVPAISAAGGTQ